MNAESLFPGIKRILMVINNGHLSKSLDSFFRTKFLVNLYAIFVIVENLHQKNPDNHLIGDISSGFLLGSCKTCKL